MRNDQHFLSACKTVAEEWRNLAHAIRKEDAYASHVTETQKDNRLEEMLTHADEIATGNITCFSIAQRVHEKITGNCVPFLTIKRQAI